jgi:hypothetical protein
MIMESKIAINIGTEFGAEIGRVIGIGGIVTAVLSNAVTIAGVILFFLIVVGGFMMIAGSGNNNPQQVAQGRQAVTAALIGFLIVFTAYWIVEIIGFITGVDIFNPGNVF